MNEYKFVVSGYDGVKVADSDAFDTFDEALAETTFLQNDTDIIIKKCTIRDGKIVQQVVDSVIRGTTVPFFRSSVRKSNLVSE